MTYTLTGKKCPTTYPMPLKPDWSNPEEAVDFKKQNEVQEEIKD